MKIELKKTSRQIVLSVLCAAFVGLAAPAVHAVPVDIELALVIDGSGSISDANYNLQKNAYANVLSHIYSDPMHNYFQTSNIAISVWQFGRYPIQVFSETLINGSDPTVNFNNLISSLTGMTRPAYPADLFQGWTAIGDAVSAAATELLTAAFEGDKLIIDVSTDGQNNFGSNPTTASNNAVTAGIDQVNCLGVGVGLCGWNPAAPNGYDWSVASYADFETTLHEKLHAEFVPEPSSVMLLGLGLAGLVAARRRKMAW